MSTASSAARGIVLRVAVFGAAALGLAGNARAMPAIDFTAGVNSQNIPDRSFDLVSTNDELNQLAFGAALKPVSQLPLWFELDYQYGSNGASLHQTGSTQLEVHDLILSAIFRHRLFGYFTWLARAGPTLSVAHLSIENGSGATDVAQWQVVPGVEGTLGLEVPFFAQDAEGVPDPQESVERRVGVGLRVEAGYAWQSKLAFNSLTGARSGAIANEPLAMGDIELQGVIFRASLFLRY